MRRMRASLEEGGLLVLKDNILEDGADEPLEGGKYLIDDQDSSVIRVRSHLMSLLQDRCGLTVEAEAEAQLGRDDLHPVWNFILK